jgi:imidazolonepropionase-like amidohydrolase
MRSLSRWLALLLVLVAPAAEGQARKRLALVGARVYPGPGEAPIARGVVLVEGTRIVAVGAQGELAVPAQTEVLDLSGAVLTAGFWNCHVHFAERKWADARAIPAAELEAQLQAMLTRYGFTSVVDTGSDWSNTRVIRDRIEAGEVPGPRVLSAGAILFPKGGRFPVDLLLALGFTPALSAMPEIETPADGVEVVRRHLDAGVDAVKLYAATWRPPYVSLPAETIRAVAAAAHLRGLPLLAHPTNAAGLRAAVENGADVLVHTAPGPGEVGTAEMALMRERKVDLIPTLKLWRWETRHDRRAAVEPFVQKGVSQLRAYAREGGTVLFGTDVGYMDDYDPTEEYELMAEAGLSFAQILAALTTGPARRFGRARPAGRIAPGQEADLVVLEADPAEDARAFARVRYTLREGQVVFSAAPTARSPR